jgi:ABC-type phosphate/phosphonate transport system substrate-binding protein
VNRARPTDRDAGTGAYQATFSYRYDPAMAPKGTRRSVFEARPDTQMFQGIPPERTYAGSDDDVKNSVRFAIPSSPTRAALAAFDELRLVVLREGGPALEPVFVPSYAALYETLAAGEAETAWAPPLVARDFVRAEIATPIVVAARFDELSYYSALVVPLGSRHLHLGDLQQCRIGWVSKLSAAGYVVPRWFLRSAGYRLDALFSREEFLGSHSSLGEAFSRATIDVAATYASVRGGAFLTADLGMPVRILGVAGPIPGDVIVARNDLAPGVASILASVLVQTRFEPRGGLRTLMNTERFAPASKSHLAPLSQWEARAEGAALRPLSLSAGVVGAP